jgi:membrane protein DedA with SNARE-associated domain
VIVYAFLGTLAGDQLYFYIGRVRGKSLLEKRPAWKSKSEKVFLLMEKYDVWLVLGFRFLYGIRTVTPFLIGTGSISSFRFLILNMLGASVWAVVVGTMGYLFGHALEVMIGNIKHYELLIIAILTGAGVFSWVVHFTKTKKP